MSRVFVNGLRDRGSISGRIIPKNKKMVLVTLLNPQHYKVRIKDSGAIQEIGWCPPLHLGVVAIERGAFGSPSTTVANFIKVILESTALFHSSLLRFHALLDRFFWDAPQLRLNDSLDGFHFFKTTP